MTTKNPMNLLIVNPNISASVTDLIQAEALRTASAETRITMATASFGVAYIETRFEALVGGYATACAAAEHAGSFDGLIVAAFGDPGLAGMKELFDVPVVGMTEAALASACLLGQRFSIIAISHRIEAWYRECVAANGLSARLASIRSLQSPLRDIGSVQEDHAARLEALSLQAVREDGADVIIVAGAPLAGLARSRASLRIARDAARRPRPRRQLCAASAQSQCRIAAVPGRITGLKPRAGILRA
jgi:Asp/Glu/hydantoin racemase